MHIVRQNEHCKMNILNGGYIEICISDVQQGQFGFLACLIQCENCVNLGGDISRFVIMLSCANFQLAKFHTQREIKNENNNKILNIRAKLQFSDESYQMFFAHSESFYKLDTSTRRNSSGGGI